MRRRALLSIKGNILYTANWRFLKFNATFHNKQKIEMNCHGTKLHNCSVFDKRAELLTFIDFEVRIETRISFC